MDQRPTRQYARTKAREKNTAVSRETAYKKLNKQMLVLNGYNADKKRQKHLLFPLKIDHDALVAVALSYTHL